MNFVRKKVRLFGSISIRIPNFLFFPSEYCLPNKNVTNVIVVHTILHLLNSNV